MIDVGQREYFWGLNLYFGVFLDLMVDNGSGWSRRLSTNLLSNDQETTTKERMGN